MDLSVIVVNYKNKVKLINCLDSFYKSSQADFSWEFIIVDNNSGDDLSALSVAYSNLKLIMSPRNQGMGGGNNLGIEKAQGKVILILNPDIIIKQKDVKVLLDYLQSTPRIGLLGPKLLDPDGSLQLSCSYFPSFFMPILRRTFLGDYFQKQRDHFMMQDFDHNSILEVDWLMGSCLMFKREITLLNKQIFKPRFDERYFMYFEDIDLARQMRAQGQKVVYNPQVSVVHDHRRQSAQYPWYLAVFLDSLARHHINSWFKYFIKWGFKI